MASVQAAAAAAAAATNGPSGTMSKSARRDTLQPPVKSIAGRLLDEVVRTNGEPGLTANGQTRDGAGRALTDTPLSTAPSSPQIAARRDSGSSTPRIRPTTLDVPGLTRSKVSPDGRIASRDIGSKLLIVMVGLPARGKSYITKKMARYLNWLQHDTRIFNVGERRRIAAGSAPKPTHAPHTQHRKTQNASSNAAAAAKILINGEPPSGMPAFEALPPPARGAIDVSEADDNGGGDDEQVGGAVSGEQNDQSGPSVPLDIENMDQSAAFFDPQNTKAAQIREQLAMATLDELLDYILFEGGSVGILDATNSNLERRKAVLKHVRERAGPELGILFLESLCLDKELLESNIRLKLSGPDYKDQDPEKALADFRKRIEIYEKNYVPLGQFEEENGVQYIQASPPLLGEPQHLSDALRCEPGSGANPVTKMIDVGRKIVAHQVRGFLAAQSMYYLVNFNLMPRMIWITRHGESLDNVRGKIGGDSDLSDAGRRYSRALARFMAHRRQGWTIEQRDKAASRRLPPRRGDGTPPYVTASAGEAADKNFCVWSSMLKRSIQTARPFDEDDFDVKQMRMLDELNAGDMDGLTYDEIRQKHPDEYELRKRDKLHYRYPGPGGEGYLDVVHRLRSVIVEVERMTDHVLLVCHRSVARVLLSYFLGLSRDTVADVEVPLGALYMIQPKPYGVAFKAFRYDPSEDWFHEDPNNQLHRRDSH